MKTKRIVSFALSLALAASLLAGCGAASSQAASAAASGAAASSAASAGSAVSSAAAGSAAAIQVAFTVTGADGTSKQYTLDATEGETLAQALQDAKLISADEAAAGYVTTVDGAAADYNKDKAWWCLTDASGSATTKGIADIQLHSGDSYAFVYTVG